MPAIAFLRPRDFGRHLRPPDQEHDMKKLMSSICAAAMLATFSMPAPALAASVPSPRIAPAVESAVETVQYRERGGMYYRGDRWDRPRHRERWDRPRFRDRDRGFYRGHRGYRYHRPGYRRHSDGFWYPAGAFIAGAIVGGALSGQAAPGTRVRDYGSAHVDWCYDRYRSYRASDNTFQPYNGPRRQCRSPYY